MLEIPAQNNLPRASPNKQLERIIHHTQHIALEPATSNAYAQWSSFNRVGK